MADFDSPLPPAGLPRRILHLIGSMDPRIGGPVSSLQQIAATFVSLGARSEVATLDPPDAPFINNYLVPVHALGGHGRGLPKPLRAYGMSPRYTRWLLRELPKVDFVIIHGLWTYTTLGAVDALKRSGTPYVVFAHGALDPWFRTVKPVKHWVKQLTWLLGDGRLVNGADRVLFTTRTELDRAVGQFWPERYKAAVVDYGVHRPPSYHSEMKTAFEAATPRLRGRRYLLYLSRIDRKKGCDLLLDAFGAVAARDPELQLVMAGPDAEDWGQTLRKVCESRGVADRVHWPGLLAGDAKWGAFYNCETFCLPSHQENFGIAVAEALACGKPVLISDQVYIHQDITTAEAGLVGPDTGPGVRSVLSRWLDMDAGERDEMGRNALACFEAHFDHEKTSLSIVETVRAILRERA